MSRKYKFHNPEGIYFVSFAVHEWVDVFTRNDYKNFLIDNLKYCQKHMVLEIYAWCLMTNYVGSAEKLTYNYKSIYYD